VTEVRVLYSEEQIRERVREVARRIASDFGGERLILVAILKGAAFLLADLARALDQPADFEFVDVNTQPGERGEIVSLTYATHFNVHGKHVLILKDVLHSGVTENYLMTHLSQQKPASMDVVALVDRPQLRTVNLTARYSVFDDVPEGYLIGYGLGLSPDEYTNRPELCVLDQK
jgi:hypoxanthine phosphoribosyltransferase